MAKPSGVGAGGAGARDRAGAVRALEGDALRLFRGFLWLYPAEFRHEYGRELCLVFVDRWRAGRSWTALLEVWLEAVAGVLVEAPKEHWHMILQDFRYALRILRKDSAVTAASIGILALGIGASTLVFSLASGLLIKPLPYPRQERLVAVEEYSPTDPQEGEQIAFPNYADIRARTRLLAEIGVYSTEQFALRGEGVAAETVPGARISDGVFGVLGVTPVLGRFWSRAEDVANGPKVAVISTALWERRWARDPAIVGRTIDVDEKRCVVVGVMPASFQFPGRADLWTPLQMDPAKAPRTDYFLHAVARLRSGVSLSQAASEMRALLAQIHRENRAADNGWQARVIPFRVFVAGPYRAAVLTLAVAVGLLLLIACANVSNLLLVKASARQREMAVRTALGAARHRLIRQLVSESILLGLTGGILGVLLAYAGVPALLWLVPIDLPRWMDFSVDQRVLGFALLVSLATGLGFGLAPAWSASSHDLATALREGLRNSGGRRQRLLRHGLVLGEVALSVALLAGAGLMVRSFVALRTQRLGYTTDRVLALRIDYPEKRYADGAPARALLHHIQDEVGALPGVAATAFASGVPMADGWGRLVTIEGRPRELKDIPSINHVVVTPGYFRALGIPLLRGRDFAGADFEAPRIVIVSASFARQNWPHESPLGKRIRFGPPANAEPWHTIVGVVADSRHVQLKGEDRPNVYLPYNSDNTPDVLVVRTAADPLRLVPAIRSRIVAVDRNIALGRTYTLAELVVRAAWQDRFFTVLFGVFAAVALLLAAVGLYAVLSYTVSLKTQEIGIRMALGASGRSVHGMFLRQGLALAGAGLGAGMLAAAALTRLLRSQLYETSPLDPAAYLAAAAVLLAAAFLAAYLPAHRATRVPPAVALRQS